MNQEKIMVYMRLMRFHKPIGTFLLLWPTLWALWIAEVGWPNSTLLWVFCIGVITTRAAGCVINDICDRQYDPKVLRTRNRPLASQQISLKEAWVIFAVMLGFSASLLYWLNPLTWMMAVVAVVLIGLYPLTKRFFYCPQLVLGLTFFMGVLMAFTASMNRIPNVAWWLYIACTIWTVAFDTQYAMADREFDRKLKLKSSALLFGQYDNLAIGICQFLMLSMLCYLGQWLGFRWPYWCSLLVASGLFFYQHRLSKGRDPDQCFKAFLNNQWVGLVIFVGIVVQYSSLLE